MEPTPTVLVHGWLEGEGKRGDGRRVRGCKVEVDVARGVGRRKSLDVFNRPRFLCSFAASFHFRVDLT